MQTGQQILAGLPAGEQVTHLTQQVLDILQQLLNRSKYTLPESLEPFEKLSGGKPPKEMFVSIPFNEPEPIKSQGQQILVSQQPPLFSDVSAIQAQPFASQLTHTLDEIQQMSQQARDQAKLQQFSFMPLAEQDMA